VIGYYVHHQGSGHLHRAWSIQQRTAAPVTGLSTLPRPEGWRGDWVELVDDAVPPTPDHTRSSAEVTAAGRLHFVPEQHPGLRARMAAVSAWIEAARPAALVVDVSIEVAMLARLHGVRIITVAQPGQRGDAGHRLGYGISDRIIAPWPAAAPDLWQVAPDHAPVEYVGAISRYAPQLSVGQPIGARVVALNGTGGGSVAAATRAARAATPDWDWVVLDRASGTWVDDPWPLLRSATVIVSHAGQNAVAEIAAARRPAVIIPQSRPFDEQRRLAAGLDAMPGLPVTVLPEWPGAAEWLSLLIRTAARDGARWAQWNDGLGATRAAALLDRYDGTGTGPDDVVLGDAVSSPV